MTGAPAGPERAILDTSVLIAEDVTPLPGLLAISAVSLAELQFGVLVARSSATRAERLRRLTDIEPVDIRSQADLDAYVARCKAHYWGHSRDTQFLHWLIDQERARLDAAA